MKDYTKDSSVPLPIASLLNSAQRDPRVDSIGYYALKLSEAYAESERLRAWALDEQQKREKVEDDRFAERRENERLQFELNAADEQISRRKALFLKIAEIADEFGQVVQEHGLFRKVKARESIINIRRIAEIARAASK